MAKQFDENGNEILPTEEQVTVSKKQYEEIVSKLAEKTQTNSNLVNEIKELREKKQLTDSEAEELRKKLESQAPITGDLTPEKVAEIAQKSVAAILQEKEMATVKESREAALKAFVEKHKEFHPDNDEAGLKMAVLQRKLNQFNTSGLRTEKDFLSTFEDARRLISDIPSKESVHTPPIAPASGGGQSPVVVDNVLSPQETKLVESTFGGDKERYLKIKAKRPDYVATLIRYSNY